QNARRADAHLRLAEEQVLPGEETCTRQIIDELTKFTRENWLPGGAQRFGNTKTFGVLRGEFSVLPGLPASLRRGLFAQPAAYPAWGGFSGPGPYAPPGIEDLGPWSVGIKGMGDPGPKLIDDGPVTHALDPVSPPECVH